LAATGLLTGATLAARGQHENTQIANQQSMDKIYADTAVYHANKIDENIKALETKWKSRYAEKTRDLPGTSKHSKEYGEIKVSAEPGSKIALKVAANPTIDEEIISGIASMTEPRRDSQPGDVATPAAKAKWQKVNSKTTIPKDLLDAVIAHQDVKEPHEIFALTLWLNQLADMDDPEEMLKLFSEQEAKNEPGWTGKSETRQAKDAAENMESRRTKASGRGGDDDVEYDKKMDWENSSSGLPYMSKGDFHTAKQFAFAPAFAEDVNSAAILRTNILQKEVNRFNQSTQKGTTRWNNPRKIQEMNEKLQEAKDAFISEKKLNVNTVPIEQASATKLANDIAKFTPEKSWMERAGAVTSNFFSAG
jgi:hypothetical protein